MVRWNSTLFEVHRNNTHGGSLVNLIRADLAADLRWTALGLLTPDRQYLCRQGTDTFYLWVCVCVCVCVCEGRKQIAHTPVARLKTSHLFFTGSVSTLVTYLPARHFEKEILPSALKAWNPTPRGGALGAHVRAGVGVQNDRSFT